jgi:hypothetical protein
MFDPKLLCLRDLPSITLDRRKELPQCQGVYFAITPESAVLYIGKARNIFKRWMQHHRLIDLKQTEGVLLAWLEIEGDTVTLDAVEAVCIEYFRPKLNGTETSPNSLGKKTFRICLPIELSNRLDELAKEEYRTPSAQLEWILKAAIQEYEAAEYTPDWDTD